jgi:hypothetical protein
MEDKENTLEGARLWRCGARGVRGLGGAKSIGQRLWNGASSSAMDSLFNRLVVSSDMVYCCTVNVTAQTSPLFPSKPQESARGLGGVEIQHG